MPPTGVSSPVGSQLPPNAWFLGPPESISQTAPWSVQPFSQSCRLWPTDRQRRAQASKFTLSALVYRVSRKSKLLILNAYVNKTEKIGGTWTEKMKHCLIVSCKISYVTVVLRFNILRLKAVNEIAARQTRTSLRKHDVIKVKHRIFNHINRISVANF